VALQLEIVRLEKDSSEDLIFSKGREGRASFKPFNA